MSIFLYGMTLKMAKRQIWFKQCRKTFNHSRFHLIIIQWNLCNPTNMYGPKVFLLAQIKPEYSDILYNQTHFPGPLMCRIIQVPLYIQLIRLLALALIGLILMHTKTVTYGNINLLWRVCVNWAESHVSDI
jgi:hypothetical protein